MGCLAEAGKAISTGGGGQPNFIPVLQGGDTGGPDLRFGLLGSVICDGEGGEGTHVEFLSHITGKQARNHAGGPWETLAVKEVLRATGMKLAADYIGRW